MYALIAGVLEETGPPTVIVAGGVGYEVWVPERARRRLPQAGAMVRLHLHLVTREDGPSLYGFPTVRERELFRLLISVSGVGPKLALSVLGDEEADAALAALCAGDATRLTAIKGIGRKTAERLVVELREKAAPWLPAPARAAAGVLATGLAGPAAEAALALIAMGVAPEQARAAIAALDRDEQHAGVESIVRSALQRITF